VFALTGPTAVVRATGRHPYARFAVGPASEVRGIGTADAVLWLGRNRHGLIGHGLGDPSTLDELRSAALPALSRGEPVRWINLPRGADIPAGYRLREHWDFRWLAAPGAPPAATAASSGDPSTLSRVDGSVEAAVVALSTQDQDAIDALLDLALPDSAVRPGTPGVHGWYGIWSGRTPLAGAASSRTLLACAADRSNPGPVEPVGVLGGIAVHPDHRGRGLGATVTAELTRRLRARYDLITLGVVAGNAPASRLYHRLGYTAVHEVTAIHP